MKTRDQKVVRYGEDDSSTTSEEEWSRVVPPRKKRKIRRKTTMKNEAFIHEKLQQMGIKRLTQTSKCVKKAILDHGFIKITGDPQDLKRVIFRGKAGCGHPVTATLQDVLKQPDFVNPDHETEHPNASVFCLYKVNMFLNFLITFRHRYRTKVIISSIFLLF